MRKPENIIPWWKTDLGQGEINRIEEAILNGWITQGPVTENLEKRLGEFLHIPYVVLTTSGSAALMMGLMACGIKHDDRVIVPALTFIATAQAPSLLGAQVKLVDVGGSKPVIDIPKVEEAITPQTKAIIPVHLNGRAADMKGINRLAQKFGIKVLEDASQALGSRNSEGFLGTQSDIGIFSLGMTKLITTGGGGFLVTKDKAIYEKLIRIRNFGMSSNKDSAPSYDIAGFNFKFNDILASLGMSQLERVDEKINSLKKVYQFYSQELKDLDHLKIVDVAIDQGELPLWIEATTPERDQMIAFLEKEGIEAKPCDRCLSDSFPTERAGDYKNAIFFAERGLILPSGPDQSFDNIKYTVQVLKNMKAHVL